MIFSADNPSVRFRKHQNWFFAGRKAELRCVASGWPLPTVKWLMNGKQVKDGDLNETVYFSESVAEESITLSLHFSEVKPQHVGEFTCEAENKFKVTRRNTEVSIKCKGLFRILNTCNNKLSKDKNSIRALYI